MSVVDPQVLELLACPLPHHAPLTEVSDGPGSPALRCTECGRFYPVRDGIIDLLVPDAADGAAS